MFVLIYKCCHICKIENVLFLYGLLSLKLKLNVILQIYAQAIHVFTSLHVLLKAMHTDVTVNPDTLATVVNQVRRRNLYDLFNYVHPKMCSCNVGRSALHAACCCMQLCSMHVFITAFCNFSFLYDTLIYI